MSALLFTMHTCISAEILPGILFLDYVLWDGLVGNSLCLRKSCESKFPLFIIKFDFDVCGECVRNLMREELKTANGNMYV